MTLLLCGLLLSPLFLPRPASLCMSVHMCTHLLVEARSHPQLMIHMSSLPCFGESVSHQAGAHQLSDAS